MPTVNKTMTLTPSNIVQHQQQQQMNGNHCGGGYSTTSPKATLRKVINNHSSALTSSNNANNQVGALFESSPSPCPSNGLYAPYSDHGNNYATATNTTMSNNPARDPYSSFRSRDAYGAGSMRSQQQQPQHSAYNGQQQLAPLGGCGGVGGLQPLDGPASLYGGTLRSSNKAGNLGDNYGTARSVKKVYL
jgi:hypothetical protein